MTVNKSSLHYNMDLFTDDSPVFISPSPDGNKTIDVSENTTVGDTILTLVATDPENDAILFDVIGEYSNIFTCIGNELKLNAALDFENTQLYRIYIRLLCVFFVHFYYY